MLGTRGCRLGILYPEIYEMQAVAIVEAAIAVRERTGRAPLLEIMIPLVDYETELELMRALVIDVAHARGLEAGRDFIVGTMIELPRACFVADQIAHHADFFSFGTNDLTQTALGFSRDDVEGRFLSDLPASARSSTARRSRRSTRPASASWCGWARGSGARRSEQLKLGVCGEHGGDPDSIAFFHHAGLDYVSCSPFRVPIARVAAAQAAVAERLAAERG